MTLTGRMFLGATIVSIAVLGGVLVGSQRQAQALALPDVCYFSETDSIALLPQSICEVTSGGQFVTDACSFFSSNQAMLDLLALPPFNLTCKPPPPPAVENTLPLCIDGIDNDGDEQIDLADSDCASFKPTLTINEIFVNDNGGTTTGFPVTVDGNSAATGTPLVLNAGAHTVVENSSSSYTVTFSSDCIGGNVTLAAGDAKTCTITNDDISSGNGGGDTGGGNGGGDTGGGNTGGGGDTGGSGNSGGGNTTPTSGGGGGGNGPIVGSFGGNGVVLGATATNLPVVSCDMFLTAFIKPGAKNDEDQVKRLQKILMSSEGASTTESGIYDDATVAAVHAFQAKYAAEILSPWGLTKSTGFVYLTTRKKINDLYCNASGQTFPLSAAELDIIAGIKQNPVVEHVTTPAVETATTPAQPAGAEIPAEDESSNAQPTTETKPSGGFTKALSDFFSRLFNRSR